MLALIAALLVVACLGKTDELQKAAREKMMALRKARLRFTDEHKVAPWQLKRHSGPQKPGLDVRRAIEAKEMRSKRRVGQKKRSTHYRETVDNIPVHRNEARNKAEIIARRLESLKNAHEGKKQK